MLGQLRQKIFRQVAFALRKGTAGRWAPPHRAGSRAVGEARTHGCPLVLQVLFPLKHLSSGGTQCLQLPCLLAGLLALQDSWGLRLRRSTDLEGLSSSWGFTAQYQDIFSHLLLTVKSLLPWCLSFHSGNYLFVQYPTGRRRGSWDLKKSSSSHVHCQQQLRWTCCEKEHGARSGHYAPVCGRVNWCCCGLEKNPSTPSTTLPSALSTKPLSRGQGLARPFSPCWASTCS